MYSGKHEAQEEDSHAAMKTNPGCNWESKKRNLLLEEEEEEEEGNNTLPAGIDIDRSKK
jgi:hypothetical protein